MDRRGRSSIESWSSQTRGWKMAHHTYRPRVQFHFAHAFKCRSQGKSFYGHSMLLLLLMSNDICALNCETGQMEEHKCDSNMGIEAESKASS